MHNLRSVSMHSNPTQPPVRKPSPEWAWYAIGTDAVQVNKVRNQVYSENSNYQKDTE